MNTGENADERHSGLSESEPGTSSATLARLMLVAGGLSVLCFGAYLATAFSTPAGDHSRDALGWALMAGAAVLLALCAALVRLLGKRNIVESEAGYTTLRRGYLDLPQRDPRTGLVIAAPSERPLTRKEHSRRLKEAGKGSR